MNADSLFEEVGFAYEYRSESEAFYRPYFEDETALFGFFQDVFRNDSFDKRPRWIMNDIVRFVTLANDIEKIRPGRDPLRILFFRICLEAICKDSGSSAKDFYKTFDTFFSEEGEDYILSNFTFSEIYEPDDLTGIEQSLFNDHSDYQLTLQDFMNVIKATRNMVAHDGDYWSMQFFARDNDSTWLTDITTKKQIISCQLGGQDLTYGFHTTMQYEKFEYYFVEACINYLKDYIKKKNYDTSPDAETRKADWFDFKALFGE